MIEYALQDTDGTQYSINDSGIEIIARKSLTYQNVSLDYDSRIIDKTFLPGSHLVGSPRLKSRELSFGLKRTGNNFETQLNTFIRKAEIAEYLVDLTNDRRIRVVLNGVRINYDDGLLKKFSEESITFVCLDPFWEDVDETEILNESLTGSSDNDITVNNTGYLDSYGRLVFTAAVSVSEIIAYITDVSEGIKIEDPLFGSGAYTELQLNNKEGTLILDTGSDEYDRAPFITPGTGFFRFPVGSNTLRITPDANCEVDIYFRKRYYE